MTIIKGFKCSVCGVTYEDYDTKNGCDQICDYPDNMNNHPACCEWVTMREESKEFFPRHAHMITEPITNFPICLDCMYDRHGIKGDGEDGK